MLHNLEINDLPDENNINNDDDGTAAVVVVASGMCCVPWLFMLVLVFGCMTGHGRADDLFMVFMMKNNSTAYSINV